MKNYKYITMLFFLFILFIQLQAEGDEKNKQNKLYKTNGEPHYTKFNINNISTWIFDNGRSDLGLNGNSGFEYPKASGKAVFYESGFIYGGKVNNEIRVGGSTYRSGQMPGRIIESGAAEDISLASVRIYKVRPDYKTANLSEEISYVYKFKYSDDGKIIGSDFVLGADANELKNQYEKDWNEWPADYGAPFEDINNDGIYNPQIDIPGVPGAHQTIWFVANDLNEEQTKFLYGSPPIGIEMQATFWGYKSNGPLGNVMFRKYTVINKSENIIDSMYFSMWSDSEIGDATDDLVGCDTLLNMTYAYNGDDHDATYGNSVPACGFVLLQGPVIQSNSFDEANFKGRKIKGLKNLDMTSLHYVYKCCGPDLSGDPPLGEYEGSIAMYNYFQGLTEIGNPFPIPESLGGGFTKYPFSGDPITGKGFVDGIFEGPGDRRMGLGTGPFTMAVGDTQEVIYAQLAAGAEEKTQRLQSLYLLKQYASFIREIFSSNEVGKPENNNPKLSGNYCDKAVILKWGDIENNINSIEFSNENSFEFEGYNIYQIPSLDASKESYVRIATFDKINGVQKIIEERINPITKEFETKVIQYGMDNGVERFIKINKDYISEQPLNNGTPYYYILSSYYYNSNITDYYQSFENFSEPIKVIPQSPNPGIRYESETGDSISILHLRGTAEADVNIIVVDPSEVNGHQFEISFKKNSENKIVWDLDDVTENLTVLSNQKNITGTDEYIIVDGIRIVITQNENNILTENDLYRFTTPKVIYNEELAKTDVDNINVFPNPYYGYNALETQKLGNFVMINHLPKRAVIRIFNLAGQLVRMLHKESEDQFYLWDLQNEHQFLVGSGLYILHIEMPDLGKVKVLKLAVVLGTEVPDFY